MQHRFWRFVSTVNASLLTKQTSIYGRREHKGDSSGVRPTGTKLEYYHVNWLARWPDHTLRAQRSESLCISSLYQPPKSESRRSISRRTHHHNFRQHTMPLKHHFTKAASCSEISYSMVSDAQSNRGSIFCVESGD